MGPPRFGRRADLAHPHDWNGRFGSSIGGSNRSYFYEEHTVWVALLDSPLDKSVLDIVPRKHIDLRTQIY